MGSSAERIIIIIILGKNTISFMQGIYTYIPETNHVPKEYNVAAVLSLLFMVPTSLAPALALMYIYISTFRSMCAVPIMAVFCSGLTSWFPGMVLTYLHVAPYHFSYLFFCPSLSVFYLFKFCCMLGLVALTVSEWSAWSRLVAVTFLSLRSTLFHSTPGVSIVGLQE
jgi:hypothetical protein